METFHLGVRAGALELPAAVGKLFSEQMETFHSGRTAGGTRDRARHRTFMKIGNLAF